MNRSHIVTCLSENEYCRFIKEGFAGLYPIKVAKDKIGNNRSMGAKIGTNWDIIADLKRVKPGDYIFLHTRGNGIINGPFEATSHFLEYRDIPDPFKSKNLNIEYWSENYRSFEFGDYPWRIGIKSIKDVTKEDGFNAMDLFKLKSLGIIQSLPERFMYHDKPKIVKPLLSHETKKILELLNSIKDSSFLSVKPFELGNYQEIVLDLKSYRGELYREKILEAFLMENALFNGENLLAHKNFKEVFGESEHFVNSIFTYYANFLDVLLYNENNKEYQEDEICENCNRYSSKNKKDIWIVELKKGFCDDKVSSQLEEYGDWARQVLANNNDALLNLCIVGTGFSKNLLSQDKIKLVKYSFLKKEPFIYLEKLNF